MIRPLLAKLPVTSEHELPATLGAAVAEMMLKLSIGLLLLAALDVAHRRWLYRRGLRMTPDEAREEARHSSGGSSRAPRPVATHSAEKIDSLSE